MYHVITNDKFPYVVYGTQQDSGSAAVFSRTDHGQITPRDWFPASGSEAGYFAPDPKNPNILYVSATYGGVSRFDLRTSFSQDITPWPTQTFGTDIASRKYRDPWVPVLLFSPFDKKTLYLGTQYIMKTTDGGLHWSTISPDLTGATQPPEKKNEGPTTVENAKQRGYGVVFTIAASSLDGGLIWAGSDTGMIHVTRDGGQTWKDVSPKAIANWNRVSLIEASHFNAGEAYAAVDAHRLDDRTPYIWRTRDYGATWQAITEGISSPSFVRAIREDPNHKGLLFAGTEFGIYVSFDDGDHWQSLQLNLPVTSVQDMAVHGDDLVIATHGRSFWILDDITLLRQVREAMTAAGAWLYRPATAIRVDNDAFLGTPLPPEEPTAENPPNGAVFDYVLKSPAQHIKIEITDKKRNLTRAFSSDDQKERKRPPMPIADRWFPKPRILEKASGMHRFVWNLQWGGSTDGDAGDEEYGSPHGPRAVPGEYEVRLTVDGTTLTQPLKISMDPRAMATTQELEEQLKLGLQMYEETQQSRRALEEIHSVQKKLADVEPKLTADQGDLKASITKAEAEIHGILAGGTGDGIGLEKASTGLGSALRVVESGDRTVPEQAIELYKESSGAMKTAVDGWNQFKASRIPELNQQLQQGKIAPIVITEIEKEAGELISQ